MKKGILIVSFGTTYRETEEKCIVPLVKAVETLFPGFEVRTAFTSLIIIRKLAAGGRHIPTPREAVEGMLKEGFTHIIVQPLHFLAGNEYEQKILHPLEDIRSAFSGFCIGEPLLSAEKDYREVSAWAREFQLSLGGEPVLFMGHGTSHAADSNYEVMQKYLAEAGCRAWLATIEGSQVLDSLLPGLLESSIKRIHLVPFMLTAGDHAHNDMAGETDSWKTRLEALGVEPVVHLRGMGNFKAIQKLYINHIRQAKRTLFPFQKKESHENGRSEQAGRTGEPIPWFPVISEKSCSGCGHCYLFCPKDVFGYREETGKAYVRQPFACVVNCSYCRGLCPGEAIAFPPEKIRGDGVIV